jgi:hypothetical protein
VSYSSETENIHKVKFARVLKLFRNKVGDGVFKEQEDFVVEVNVTTTITPLYFLIKFVVCENIYYRLYKWVVVFVTTYFWRTTIEICKHCEHICNYFNVDLNYNYLL